MRATIGLLLLLLFSANTFAKNGVSLSGGTNIGRGDHVPMDFYRLTYKWDWTTDTVKKNDWYLTVHGEISLIRILSDVEVTRKYAKSSLTAVAFTPIFRWTRLPFHNGIAPFVEAGVGVSYFSADRIQSQTHWYRDYGSRLQFEDRFSVGLIYQGQYRLSLDFTHYSNLDFAPPNEGIDLVSATVGFDF